MCYDNFRQPNGRGIGSVHRRINGGLASICLNHTLVRTLLSAAAGVTRSQVGAGMADCSPRHLSHFVVLKEHMAVMLCLTATVLSTAKREGDRRRDGTAMAAFAFEQSQGEGSPGSDEALMQELAALYMARRPCARFTCVMSHIFVIVSSLSDLLHNFGQQQSPRFTWTNSQG